MNYESKLKKIDEKLESEIEWSKASYDKIKQVFTVPSDRL